MKDYRDTGAHLAWRNQIIPATSGWQQVSIPLDFNQPGWNINGSPDLERSRFFGFVAEANQGQTVSGQMYLDDVTLVESGGSLDSQTAPLSALADRLARRQFQGLWGSRNRSNGLIPLSSASGSAGALNNTAAMVKMLPGAVARNWVAQSEADDYVQAVVGTLNSAMDSFSTYLPPRYMNMTTLAPTVAEESSVDAAFMALALHQYKSQSTTSAALSSSINTLQNRFDFSSFSDTSAPALGWKLAYQTDSNTFTTGTYDGYSGEPWLISLAAHLSDAFHVDINTHYHSAIFRQSEFLVNEADAHLVHSFDNFRAPFLQWLLPLFVDVSERGVDTYPIRSLASNPVRNAEQYQREIHAWFASQGRADLLQPDAGDDGSGTLYQQFSAYNDFGRPDLIMPWSAAFSLLGDVGPAENALRNMLDASLQGPLGLTDSARWSTGDNSPYQVTARQDLWNTSLATMALFEFLYGDNAGFSSLPEVETALDQVFFLTWDGQGDGSWNSNLWNGGQAPPTALHDAQIATNVVTLIQSGAAHRTRVTSGRLHVDGTLISPIEVSPDGALSGGGSVTGDVQIEGVFALTDANDELHIDGRLTLGDDSQLVITDSFGTPRGTLAAISLLMATEGVTGEFGNVTGGGIASHLGDGYFLESITHDPNSVTADLLAAWPGDANGDRVVDGQDFILWNTHKFQSGTTWIQGDFNLDGITDGLDFIIWNESKFTSYDVQSIPEPGLLPLLAWAVVLWRWRWSC